MSIRSLAENMGVAASTLARVVRERSSVSPEMALRLSKAIGRSPESWLAMQDNYDLRQARKSANLSRVRKIRFEANAQVRDPVCLNWSLRRVVGTVRITPPLPGHKQPGPCRPAFLFSRLSWFLNCEEAGSPERSRTALVNGRRKQLRPAGPKAKCCPIIPYFRAEP